MTESPSVLVELDGWIRRRIRCFMLKQWKPGRGRRRALKRLGVREAGHISGSRKGPWRLSKTKQTHEGLNLKWFEEKGLFSLKQRWRELSKAN